MWRLNHGIRAIVSLRPSNPRLLLIEVGRRQFDTHGFAGTTVQAIASLAGVRSHVVYNLFGSKAGLFKEIEAARWRPDFAHSLTNNTQPGAPLAD